MSAIKWYKRDPDAALGGMMQLTLEERGAYNTILDLIYSHSDNLIDDDRFLAGWMRCDMRVWKRIKKRLLELGKITCENGLVTNLRATSEVDEALGRVASVSELNRIKGLKSGIARRKINELAEPRGEPNSNTTTTTTRTTPKGVVHTRELATRIPMDFKPDETAHRIAKELGFKKETGRQILDNFIDYWKAASGRNATKRDWQAAFRVWMRKEIGMNGNGKTARSTGSIEHSLGVVERSIDDEIARIETAQRGAGDNPQNLEHVPRLRQGDT